MRLSACTSSQSTSTNSPFSQSQTTAGASQQKSQPACMQPAIAVLLLQTYHWYDRSYLKRRNDL
jgi:hypothetical protein